MFSKLPGGHTSECLPAAPNTLTPALAFHESHLSPSMKFAAFCGLFNDSSPASQEPATGLAPFVTSFSSCVVQLWGLLLTYVIILTAAASEWQRW